ncbi:uncharacterized protein LOC127479336 isoform X9 [Manacus candei]|uniref:uncharacterized protein LOC127479336 isoform X9 n=1 Tax=Manacus candei TaxID=415023 RepID=UPI0022275D0C|nr:uncharacterized protein LOC127479336 isoform X9 [Manacus candei]
MWGCHSWYSSCQAAGRGLEALLAGLVLEQGWEGIPLAPALGQLWQLHLCSAAQGLGEPAEPANQGEGQHGGKHCGTESFGSSECGNQSPTIPVGSGSGESEPHNPCGIMGGGIRAPQSLWDQDQGNQSPTIPVGSVWGESEPHNPCGIRIRGIRAPQSLWDQDQGNQSPTIPVGSVSGESEPHNPCGISWGGESEPHNPCGISVGGIRAPKSLWDQCGGNQTPKIPVGSVSGESDSHNPPQSCGISVPIPSSEGQREGQRLLLGWGKPWGKLCSAPAPLTIQGIPLPAFPWEWREQHLPKQGVGFRVGRVLCAQNLPR